MAGAGPSVAEKARLMMQYPTALDLRRRARRVLPNFAFEYMDGGAGSDGNIARNWAALDAVEMVPRYGHVILPPACEVKILGRLARPRHDDSVSPADTHSEWRL